MKRSLVVLRDLLVDVNVMISLANESQLVTDHLVIQVLLHLDGFSNLFLWRRFLVECRVYLGCKEQVTRVFWGLDLVLIVSNLVFDLSELSLDVLVGHLRSFLDIEDVLILHPDLIITVSAAALVIII